MRCMTVEPFTFLASSCLEQRQTRASATQAQMQVLVASSWFSFQEAQSTLKKELGPEHDDQSGQRTGQGWKQIFEQVPWGRHC